MLENFRLMAIVNQGNEWELQEILPYESLYENLVAKWEEQYKDFTGRTTEIDFKKADPDYKTGDDQVFKLCSFDLPPCLADKDSENIINTAQFRINEISADSIKGVVAFARKDENELMLFQHFNPGQIIRPGGLIRGIRTGESRYAYTSVEDSTFRLGNKLTAVYSSKDKKLLFDSFYNARKFIPSLAELHEDLSKQAIDDHVLSHSLFECEDEDKAKVLENTTRTMRTAFTIFKKSGILDLVSAEDISAEDIRDEAYKDPEKNVNIQIKEGKIVFPTEKDEITTLLDFLNENMFRGSFTNTLFMSNSKRKV